MNRSMTDSSGTGIATRRNRYFTGKFMTETDFATDPEYFLSRHRTHNRLLHGSGIVSGFEVEPHPEPRCRPRWVVVTAGLAIDGHGREILLQQPAPVEIAEGDSDAGPLVLFARYGEEDIEAVPALYAEGVADPGLRIANRVRELVTWQVVPFAEVGNEWPAGAETSVQSPSGEALERVALALISPGTTSDALTIDPGGRRQLAEPTRITGLSWTHGGTVTVSELSDMEGVLEVSFSRQLQSGGGDATGVNAFTFLVDWGLPQSPRQPMAGTVELSADRGSARFVLDPAWLRASDGRAEGCFFITLKCDFILDLNGNPVDGGHLRGRPGGRGIPGGRFESWFSVSHEEHYRDRPTDHRRRLRRRR